MTPAPDFMRPIPSPEPRHLRVVTSQMMTRLLAEERHRARRDEVLRWARIVLPLAIGGLLAAAVIWSK